MSIRFSCPSCMARVQASAALVGKCVKCPKCGHVVRLHAADPLHLAKPAEKLHQASGSEAPRDVARQLQELQQLHGSGALSEAEFAEAKRAVLHGLPHESTRDGDRAAELLPPNAARGRQRATGFRDLYMKFLVAYLTVLATQVTVLLPQSEAVDTFNQVTSLPRMVCLVVLSGIFLYRAWAQIQDGNARTTPGKAVGYRFIPFFNFYWEFVAVKGLAEDIEQYAHARKIAVEPIGRPLPLWHCILLCVAGGWMVVAAVSGAAAGLSGDPEAIASAAQVAGIVGFLLGIPAAVVLLLLFKKLADVSDAIAEAKSTTAAAGVGLTTDETVPIAVAIVEALEAGVEKAIDERHH